MEKEKENILQEIIEFAVSVVWLGIAFGIALAGGIEAFSDFDILGKTIIQSVIVVFFAFVFHELAHRIISRRYGFKAVYHVWIPGLLLALAASLIGMLFAVPGGVHIQTGQETTQIKVKLGKSALAGPITNMILAIVSAIFVFLLIYFAGFYFSSTASSLGNMESILELILGIGIMGVQINTWLALFNLLPFGNFDGYKVFQWNRKVWAIAFGGSVILFALMYWGQTVLLG